MKVSQLPVPSLTTTTKKLAMQFFGIQIILNEALFSAFAAARAEGKGLMMQKIGKIGYYTFLGFLGLIAFAIAATVLPITGNYKILVVLSGSMEPAIKTGSVVIVKPASEYSVGDIITFGPVTKTKPPTTHRIVDVEVQAGSVVYVTKGDANEDSDGRSVAGKDVLGKILFSVPYFGYVIDFARKPLGFALIIGVPAAIIIGDEVRKIFVETRQIIRRKKVSAQSHEKN